MPKIKYQKHFNKMHSDTGFVILTCTQCEWDHLQCVCVCCFCLRALLTLTLTTSTSVELQVTQSSTSLTCPSVSTVTSLMGTATRRPVRMAVFTTSVSYTERERQKSCLLKGDYSWTPLKVQYMKPWIAVAYYIILIYFFKTWNCHCCLGIKGAKVFW